MPARIRISAPRRSRSGARFPGRRRSARPEGVIAGPKHFAGYGAALGGRDYDEVNLSDSELWNVYLPPFKAAVDAGAGNVMTAYMDLNGIPATGNTWLFTEVLRDTWGFEGFVVSDSKAVRSLVTHGFAADLTDAAARGVNAGVDMEMAMFDPAYDHLPEALDSGAANAEAVDASVTPRAGRRRSRMGLFDAPYVDEDRAREVLADPAHREVARLRPSAPRCCCATRTICSRSTPDALTSIAVDRAARRLQARHPRPVGVRLRSRRDHHRARRDPRRVGDGVQGRSCSGVARVQRLFPSPFDRMDPHTHRRPESFDERGGVPDAPSISRRRRRRDRRRG